MSDFSVRLPARADLGCKELDHYHLSNETSRLILKKCGVLGTLTKLNDSGDLLEGYYFLKQESIQLFLKIIPVSHLDQQLEANVFAEFAKKQGVQVSSVLPGFPKKLSDSLVILAYDWVEGRSLRSSSLEMEELGCQLGALHKALGSYPGGRKVKERTELRLKALQKTAKRVHRSAQEGLLSHTLLGRLLNANPGCFEISNEACQVLHGDLNIGNLRWTNSGVVFLDFEDARHSWLPPRIDVAFALERVALINEPDDARAFENACSLLKGYVENVGRSPFHSKGSLKESLTWLSIRSLCLLQHFEWEGSKWPNSEREKFSILIEHMNRRSEMLLDIEGVHS